MGISALFMRSEREAYGEGSGKSIAAGGDGRGLIGQAAILRERIPHFGAVACGISGEVGDFGSVAGEGGNGELAVPLVLNGPLARRSKTMPDIASRRLFGDEAVEVLLGSARFQNYASGRETSPPCWSTKTESRRS